MSNNTLKKPVLLSSAAGYNPQFGQSSVPNSSSTQSMAVPSVSIQNPQNVYFIYGNTTFPMESSATTTAMSSEQEKRFNIIENRVSAAIAKFENMMQAQEEKAKPTSLFGGNLFRPATADGVVHQNRLPLFGQQTPFGNEFTFNGTRSFERPFWFGNDNNAGNQNSFARAKGIFEQQQAQQHAGMSHNNNNNNKLGCQIRPCSNLAKLMQNQKENNLDIIDGIIKPNGNFTLRDFSDDEN